MNPKYPQGWSIPADTSCFEARDLYKLLYQAYLGPEHAIPSAAMAEKYLLDEWVGLGPTQTGEAPLEILVGEAPFARIHLRPYRDLGGTVPALLQAFLHSGEVAGDRAAFQRAWEDAREWASGEGSTLTRAAFDDLDDRVRKLGFPALHHSAAYERRFRPAYRVVARAMVGDLLEGLPED